MSDETDLIKLYSARILALTAEIPHLGRMEAPQASVKRRSPLCGSTVTVDVRVEQGRLAEMKQDVKACALGQAAAGVLGQSVLGASADEINMFVSQGVGIEDVAIGAEIYKRAKAAGAGEDLPGEGSFKKAT